MRAVRALHRFGLLSPLIIAFLTASGLAITPAAAQYPRDPILDFVGEWNLPSSTMSIMIAPNHSIWHSQWGRGDITHDNADYYLIRYRSRDIKCHYIFRMLSPNELSAGRAENMDPADCDLGELRRAPGSQLPGTGSFNEKNKVDAGPGSKIETPGKDPGKEAAKEPGKEPGKDPGKEPGKDPGNEPGGKTAPDSKTAASNPQPNKDNNPPGANAPGAKEQGTATPPAPEKEPAKVAAKAEKPGDTIQDCEMCPELAVLPEGTFMMGSTEAEPGHRPSEGPAHFVQVKSLALGIYPVTRKQFGLFLTETGYNYTYSCRVRLSGKFEDKPGRSYLNPGFPQDDSHPAVCVSWNDALAYVSWLSQKTGKIYRLPSEAEREYAARAGTSTPYSFGTVISSAVANFDQDATPDPTTGLLGRGTLPVRTFQPNAFGLYQMHGNVSEWTQDCWNGSYAGAPGNGAASGSGECNKRVLRGGGFGYPAAAVRSAYREGDRALAGDRFFHVGFRVARVIQN
jgi:formylglycine-generating enzyme required for sulfatase activity